MSNTAARNGPGSTSGATTRWRAEDTGSLGTGNRDRPDCRADGRSAGRYEILIEGRNQSRDSGV